MFSFENFFKPLLKLSFITLIFIIVMLFIIGPLPIFTKLTPYQFFFDNEFIESKYIIFLTTLKIILKDFFITLPLIALMNVRILGPVIILLEGFLIGLEQFLFYIQGSNTAFNAGMNTFMAENFVKSILNPEQISTNSSYYTSDPMLYIFLIGFPIGLLISMKILFLIFKLNPLKIELSLPLLFGYGIFASTAYYLTMPHYHRVLNSAVEVGSEYYNSFFLNIQREKPFLSKSEDTKYTKIVYIIGESVRGDYISLNNPIPHISKASDYLLKLQDQGNLINFGKTYSTGNCSHISNKFLLTGFPKGIELNYSVNPTFFQYFKQAGYSTHQIDAPHEGYFNGRKIYDNPFIDSYTSVSSAEKNFRDLKSLEVLDTKLSAPGKQFIYLVQQGTHFPFEKSYEKETQLYKNTKNALYSDVDSLPFVNNYLNAINWSVNEFWKELDKLASKHPDTLFVFTGDHGVNILPDNNGLSTKSLITHCSANFKNYKSVYNVPLFVYSKNKDLLSNFSFDNTQKTHKQLFPTLLELAGYDKTEVEKIYGPTINEKDSEVFLFKTGFGEFAKLEEVDSILKSEKFVDRRRDLNKMLGTEISYDLLKTKINFNLN